MSGTAQARCDVWEAVMPARLLFVGPPAVEKTAQNDRLELADHELALEAGHLRIASLSTFQVALASAARRPQVREGDGAGSRPARELKDLVNRLVHRRWVGRHLEVPDPLVIGPSVVDVNPSA